MRKKINWFLTIFFSLVFFGCQTIAPINRVVDKQYSLTVMHVNDTHGAILPNEKGEGGLAYVADFIKKERAKSENALVLHAGDLNTGSALSNMFMAEPDIKAFNEMGVDFATLGNHEFDGSTEKLKKQIELSRFTWLSANIKDGNSFFVKPYAIKDYDGFRVAVIGVTTNRTTVIASPDKRFTFLNEIDAVKHAVKKVREVEKADIVIIASHLGIIEEASDQVTSIKLAENISGVDLIVDGHSHTYMESPKVVNNIPIVSANEHGKYVGKGVFKIVNGKVKSFNWEAYPINTKTIQADVATEAILAPYVAKAESSLNDVVLQTTSEFEFGNRLTRYKEMPIGNFVCDAIVAYVKNAGINVDGSLTNGGNIRAPFPKGNVTKNDVLTTLPFENYVYVLTLKGSDVQKLFEFVAGIKQGAGAYAQVSKEIRYTIIYDKDGNGKLSNLTIGGKPVDKNRTYKIATNDYLAGGGDGYEIFTKSIDTHNTSMLLSTVVIDYAKSLKGVITPQTDGRIQSIGGIQP